MANVTLTQQDIVTIQLANCKAQEAAAKKRAAELELENIVLMIMARNGADPSVHKLDMSTMTIIEVKPDGGESEDS